MDKRWQANDESVPVLDGLSVVSLLPSISQPRKVKEHYHDEKVAAEEEKQSQINHDRCLVEVWCHGELSEEDDQEVLSRFLTKLSLDCDQPTCLRSTKYLESTLRLIQSSDGNKKYIKQTISRNDPHHRYLGINRRKHYSSQTVSETSTTAAQSQTLQLFFFLFHGLYTSLQRPAKP
jgi:hypothetical protein